MALFQEAVVRKHLLNIDEQALEIAYDEYKRVYSPAKIKNIRVAKEEQYQEGFIKEIFGSVLGYSVYPDSPFNIQTEKKNETNSRKADGAILKDEKVVGVIELKDNKTKNLDAVKDQAFGYKNNHKECSYVISSNFHKLRFYIDDATEYEEFDLYNLDKESFKRFYLYLRKEGLLDKNLPKLLRQETKFHEEEISKKLYKDYSNFKRSFFENAVKNNPQYDKLELFKKSQKFLDRILFLLFAEDKGLVGTNSIVNIVDRWSGADDDYYQPLYEMVNKYFGHLYNGYTYQKTNEVIPQFGGELFAPDQLLESLKIDDNILKNDLLILSKYDFNTDVDVNILGHIFEHSLNEVDDVEAELRGEVLDKTKSKRKKDGVFYTPKYITKYIVDNTLGKLCNEKKTELKLDEDIAIYDYQKSDGKLNEKGKNLFERLNNYKSWLLTVKVCDPACGSGAFLNQALSYFIEEHKFVDDLIAELTNSPLRLFDTDLQILENNIYGVDINEESVEIAKLSMWLRTAQTGRKLSDLSNNIKCGNSLIDDYNVAGDKAFNWEREFPKVFDKGGFDVVIGNPPYVRRTQLNDKIKVGLEKIYYSAFKQYDLYVLFNELALKITKSQGLIGYIQPNKFLSAEYGFKILNLIINNSNILKIYDVSLDKVFSEASVYPYIFIFEKTNYSKDIQDKLINIFDYCKDENLKGFENIINSKKIIAKIVSNSVKIRDLTKTIKRGVPNTKIEYRENMVLSGIKSTLLEYPYFLPQSDVYFEYLDKKDFVLKESEFSQNLILLPRTTLKIRAILKHEPVHILDRIYYFKVENNRYLLEYVLSILNSKITTFYYDGIYGSTKIGGGYIDLKGSQIENFLIPKTDIDCQKKFKIKSELMMNYYQKLHEQSQKFQRTIQRKFELEELPKKLQDWYKLRYPEFIKELAKKNVKLTLFQEAEWEDYFILESKNTLDLKAIIDATEKEIDQMVYHLYGLTEDEIQIVENF
jgi:type I restriction-modification system DNA methylase subunit